MTEYGTVALLRTAHLMPHVACLLLGALVTVSACTSDVDTSWHSGNGHRWRQLDVPTRGRHGFQPLRAERTGVTHQNMVSDENALANRNLILGAGVAVGDVDGDGLPDLFLTSVEQPASLYRNAGDNRFVDVTAASGFDTRLLGTTGALFADVNGDRHLDLLVGTLGGPLMLWVGDGRGRFADATRSSGLTPGFAVTTMTAADADGDGDLDLYVATYKVRNALDVYAPAERAFDRTVRQVGDSFVVVEEWKHEYRLEDRPELGGVMRSQRAEPDLYFENDGSGTFRRVPMKTRFMDASGRPIVEEPDHFTLAARFYDVNGDAAPDLYVCNDFEDPDQFWINQGNGTFRSVSWEALRETSILCMSVDFADINRDGHVDFFTADMMSPTLEGRQRQFPINTPQPKLVGIPRERQQWMRNTLQLSRGDGTWASIGDFAGVTATDWTWGSAFLDVDLDGYEDLLAVNGHRWDVRDADTFQRIRHSFPRVAWNREQNEFPRSATRSVAFRNNADLTFTDVSRTWRFGSDEAITHGIALGDLDGDGDLDVVTTRLNEPPVIYRNEANAPRTMVRLVGHPPNVSGIGARVTVRADGLPLQSREMTAGGYYLSGSAPELTFAAGRDSVLEIEVRWRDGSMTRIPDAAPNRLYEIHQTAMPVREPGDPNSVMPVAQAREPLFEDATVKLGGHVHVDSLFDDYRRQPLLPNRLSQLGPGVTWYDADSDDRADLVVGAGRGGTLALLRNTGGAFVLETSSPAAPATRWDLTTLLPLPVGDGRFVLAAGQSNYEAPAAAAALAVPAVASFTPGRGRVLAASTPLFPPDSGSTGPLAAADVNGDGLLDVFVGVRSLPAAWPLPASSRLYLRTREGGWQRDTLNAAALAGIGLVSAALLTDLTSDGWPDLVVTSEWGPIRVFVNERGRLRNMTRELGLAGITSRWHGLNAGDFNGDGRLDLVATSWGRNIPWRASADRPYTLVAGHFGGAGMGLLFARRDSLTGREMPLQSLERLAIAVPAARSRFASFAAFSRASMDDVLGERARGAVRVGATTFDHLVFLNQGNRFVATPLPAQAQLAPAFAPVVGDFNGDGREDLYLAQNFSATEIDTPMFHAGIGLVLLGDGHGGFRPLSVSEAGIRVWGDQRGAAASDYDADGRLDLAVTQNGAATTLWHNRGAAPGLRVRVDGGLQNPHGVGAQLRVINGSGAPGPLREIRAGSAYWSMDDPVAVVALPPGASALWVRWPGGDAEAFPLAAGAREMRVSRPR